MPESHIPTLADLREQHSADPNALEAAAGLAAELHRSAVQEIHRKAGNDALTASQQRSFDSHAMAETELTRFVSEQRLARVGQSRAKYGVTKINPSDPSALNDSQASAARSAALGHLDQAVRQGWMHDQAAEKLTGMIDQGSHDERGVVAYWAATAGAPAYRSAFARVAGDPQHGFMSWTPAEADAYRAVQHMRESLSARTALTMAGYVLPVSLDPAVMLTNDGSMTPLRQLARVVTTLTSTWRGITSAGATAEWKTEGAQAADGTPGAAEVEIPVFASDVDAIYSYELGQDANDFLSQIEMVIRDALDNLWSVAYTTGGGSTAPQGFVTGLAGTASEINTSGSEAIDKTDPTRLQAALGARFSANASWLSHIATKNGYAFMETTNGALLFPELRQNPASLLGKPWYECSTMDGSINAAATANNFALAYGDVRRAFVIVDHPGTSMEFLPGFGANGRPTGQRHAFLFSRTGSKVVVPEAMRLLDVPTTA